MISNTKEVKAKEFTFSARSKERLEEEIDKTLIFLQNKYGIENVTKMTKDIGPVKDKNGQIIEYDAKVIFAVEIEREYHIDEKNHHDEER